MSLKHARHVCFFLLAFLIISSLSALELKSGSIRLLIDEVSGRFSLYSLDYEKDEGGVALFSADDPRSSFFELLINSEKVRLEKESGFRITLQREGNAASVIWWSDSLIIEQDFFFISSPESTQADGIKIMMRIMNNSSSSITLAYRYLIDTYLGEKGGDHFQTASLDAVRRESSLIPSETDFFFKSPSDTYPSLGLVYLLWGDAISKPYKVVFANWKRLEESAWDYEVSSRRNYNLLPYSINDSAALVSYPEQELAAGADTDIEILMGDFPATAFQPGSQDESTEDISARSLGREEIPLETREDVQINIQSDITAVNALIESLNQKINSTDKVSEQDIDFFRNLIDTLSTRLKKYD